MVESANRECSHRPRRRFRLRDGNASSARYKVLETERGSGCTTHHVLSREAVLWFSRSLKTWRAPVTGDHKGTRTPNPQLRRLVLYPVELCSPCIVREGHQPLSLPSSIWECLLHLMMLDDSQILNSWRALRSTPPCHRSPYGVAPVRFRVMGILPFLSFTGAYMGSTPTASLTPAKVSAADGVQIL